jgi:DNA-binding transcriptional regulator YhcF (GntR family)
MLPCHELTRLKYVVIKRGKIMITFDKEMNSLSPERRAKIEAKTQELLQKMQLIQECKLLLNFRKKELVN